MATHLCKCNYCETVMYDENPSNNQREYTEEELAAATITIENMEQVEEEDSEEDDVHYFWACPVCQTDDTLKDYDKDLS
jgi:thioredoxin-related protein